MTTARPRGPGLETVAASEYSPLPERGRSPKVRRQAYTRDVPADADAWLAEQQRTQARFGTSTRNGYTQALKAFGQWLIVSRKAAENPFARLAAVNAAADPRKERRSLAAAEFDRLLAAARTGRPKLRLTGPQRELLYLTASYTGLRAP